MLSFYLYSRPATAANVQKLWKNQTLTNKRQNKLIGFKIPNNPPIDKRFLHRLEIELRCGIYPTCIDRTDGYHFFTFSENAILLLNNIFSIMLKHQEIIIDSYSLTSTLKYLIDSEAITQEKAIELELTYDEIIESRKQSLEIATNAASSPKQAQVIHQPSMVNSSPKPQSQRNSVQFIKENLAELAQINEAMLQTIDNLKSSELMMKQIEFDLKLQENENSAPNIQQLSSNIENEIKQLSSSVHPAKQRDEVLKNHLVYFLGSKDLSAMLHAFNVLKNSINQTHINFHRNPTLDKILGIKNTHSWQVVWQHMRDKAEQQLFSELAQLKNVQEKKMILESALKSPLFNQHISNFIFTGAWGNTSVVKKIKHQLDILNKNTPNFCN